MGFPCVQLAALAAAAFLVASVAAAHHGDVYRASIRVEASRLDCSDFGTKRHHARGTAYYPHNSTMEGGYYDMRGNPLITLQDFLQGNGSYVSTAMDNTIGIKYGTPLCIPELNTKYRRLIRFEMVDTGSAFRHKGYSRIDVCVRTLLDTFDKTINGPLTLVFH